MEFGNDIIESLTLNAHEWRGVIELSNAIGTFEPLAKRGNIGEIVAERLVELRLAEKGPCPDRYSSDAYPIGYRLTELGWKFKERGRYPKHKRS